MNKKRTVEIERGDLLGGLETTSGTTYLRVEDISAITVRDKTHDSVHGTGLVDHLEIDIHMVTGTIFTLIGGLDSLATLNIPITVVEANGDRYGGELSE
tara:strand:- start:10603 stop:10899 length:297 start_codon:yes stop_codon:yes gene_type:complete